MEFLGGCLLDSLSDTMDAEQREAFKGIDSKLETLRTDVNRAAVETAREVQKIASSTAAAHHRLDEHVENHRTVKRSRMALWMGVVLALVSSFFAWLFGEMRG